MNRVPSTEQRFSPPDEHMSLVNGDNRRVWASECSKYEMGREIGKGGMGVVQLAVCRASGVAYAVKIVKPGKEHKAAKEAKVLRSCAGNKHVLQLHEACLAGAQKALVLELADCDLFEVVLESGGLSEEVARPLFAGLMDGLKWIHQAGVAHRDIKLENLLLKDGVLKIADFDLAATQEERRESQNEIWHSTPCGTFSYSAPEVVAGDTYVPALVDVWSSGICLFAMLTCEFPFTAPDSSCAEFCNLLQGNYTWPTNLSPGAIHLIGRLLVVEPTARLPIEGALAHSWCSRASQ